MRISHVLAAAGFLVMSSQAFAQGPSGGGPEQPADPAQSKAADEAYLGRCGPKASPELCACVVAVANAQINDIAERQVFYDFMMGDVDKAKTARSMFSPDKNMKFNIKLQKADTMLGDNCDKLKPQQPAEAPKP